ncbi:TonB-dependent hemoglobin/transferrin/lactoferrin family receptor [Shinella daejeonensis]|uniref:TonB-dependent receptor n=1 Tax=Shinella daejeonensis TaxID=659017 RepID=UPI0020C75D88|nr:TonB-dependent hemoglobin/transferrin/lactoferrin family receptor [Shinella daejeonensis]MCP8896224.1 TonB-dependent hemoglobin/transferrin/lactoferrin family receptor [Shinella daejeonensis]
MIENVSVARRASFRRRAGLLAAGVASVSLAMPLSAQSQDNDAGLTQAQATVLEEIVVLSTRRAKKPLDIPQSISVIDRQQLDDYNVRDIQDLVRREPGIAVNRQTSITNPWGQLTSFSIRGMGGNRVQLSVDGSRVQEQITDGSRDFFDMSNMKAVEIVRGPNSVLWGADALGGAVMFRTRDPSDLLAGSDKPWALETKTGYDSFDRSWRKQVTAAYDFGDVQVLGSYGHVSSSEPRLRNARADGGIWGCTRPYIGCNVIFPADTDVNNALAKVVWTPDGEHTVKLTGELFGRDTSILQLYDMSEVTTGIPTTTGYLNDPYIRDLEMSRKRIALEHNWDVGANWLDTLNWRLSYSPQSRETDSNQRRRYSDRYQLHNQYRNYSEDFFEADVQLQSSFDLGSTHHTLIYGFDGDRTEGDYAGINTTYNSLTDTTTTAINQGFSFPRVTTQRADFYIQDEIELLDGRLTLTPGLRFAHYSIDPTEDKSYPGLPGFPPQKQTHNELIKRFSAIYKFDDTYSAYAAYGEGFKMPTSAQLFQSSTDLFTGSAIIPNPALRPESVQNYEVGFRGELDRGYFTVGAFYAEYTDFIRGFHPVTIIDPTGVPVTAYTSSNVEDVRFWGIEIGGEYEVMENTTASANIAWSRGRQKVNAGAATTAFDGAIPLVAVLGLRHEMPDYGLQFELFTTLASGRTENASATAFLPSGYALFDAYAKWSPRKDFELTVGIENIFDRRYFPNSLTGYERTPASTAVANVNPLELQTGAGRTFKIGATVKF